MGVDLDTLELTPSIGGKGGHGGYAGPAVKPIALNMLAALGTDEIVSKSGLPISGMGGIATWQDAAQFLLLGASSLQVCTAVMHYGFRIIEDLCDGLSNWMDEKGFETIADVSGRSLHRVSEFKNFDLSYRAVARIDAEQMHQVRSLLRGLQRHRAPVHRSDLAAGRAGCSRCAYDVRSNGKRRGHRRRGRSPWFAKKIAWAAGSAITCARWTIALQMVEVPSGRSAVTWSELSEQQTQVTEDWEAMKAYREQVGIHIH